MLGLSLISLLIGVSFRENIFSFIGLFFLFNLGLVLLSGNLEYKTGYTESVCDYEEAYVYGDNYSGEHWDYTTPPPSCTPNNLDCVMLFHTFREYDNSTCPIEIMYTYSSLDKLTAYWYGFLLCLASGFGMGMILMNANRDFKAKKLKNEEFGED